MRYCGVVVGVWDSFVGYCGVVVSVWDSYVGYCGVVLEVWGYYLGKYDAMLGVWNSMQITLVFKPPKPNYCKLMKGGTALQISEIRPKIP